MQSTWWNRTAIYLAKQLHDLHGKTCTWSTWLNMYIYLEKVDHDLHGKTCTWSTWNKRSMIYLAKHVHGVSQYMNHHSLSSRDAVQFQSRWTVKVVGMVTWYFGFGVDVATTSSGAFLGLSWSALSWTQPLYTHRHRGPINKRGPMNQGGDLRTFT